MAATQHPLTGGLTVHLRIPIRVNALMLEALEAEIDRVRSDDDFMSSCVN